MKKLLTIMLILFYATIVCAQRDTINYAAFNSFNNEVLKGHVSKKEAQRVIDVFIGQVTRQYKLRAATPIQHQRWVFPLKGYNYRATGGSNGDGYNDKGFRYIDGNKHGAHPAHDIFIIDKNQDCLDDHTLQPVDVQAVRAGIVIACTNEWDETGNMRGGRYVWIWHPEGFFSYYAHNRTIFVKPGDYVQQSQKIAEVGRTGFNAFKKRSPTHLHFSTFKLVDNIPVPFNSFDQLKKAVDK
ncbi:hypothetical protein A0256_08610 [Mucilaginibacter sp. PAMC 26640]|nr:hypothetical protein A0256_08610 [Mucilaginibacter sp. PAMC 26640]